MVTVELDDSLVAVMGSADRPIGRLARELIVLELNREGVISKGKVAELLDMPLLDYIRWSGKRGVPYLDWDAEDWEQERNAIERFSQQ